MKYRKTKIWVFILNLYTLGTIKRIPFLAVTRIVSSNYFSHYFALPEKMAQNRPCNMREKKAITFEIIDNPLNASVTSYKNQAIDLLSKSTDWFLYEGNTGIYWDNAHTFFSLCTQKWSTRSWTRNRQTSFASRPVIWIFISELKRALNINGMVCSSWSLSFH